MFTELAKALLIGVLAAIPLGPVAVFIAQKTLARGRFCGRIAGIGAAVIDALYAAVALFALGFIKDFLLSNEVPIMLAGGALILTIGSIMAISKKSSIPKRTRDKKTAAGYAIQTAGFTLSNPAAFVVMASYIAVFHLNAATVKAPVWMIVVLVGMGEFLYWCLFSYLISKIDFLKPETIVRVGRLAGVIIAAIGLSVIIKGLLML